MTRRPKVGGKPIKGRLPNAQKPRRSKMAKAAPRSMSSSSRDQTEVTRLKRELNAAIERQNATAEILASVSRSSTDTRPVFDAILDNLLRLFRTRFALVLLVRNGMFEVGGIKGDLSFDELAKHYPLPVDERLLPGKAVLAGRPMQLSPIVGNVEAPSNTQRMAIEFGFNAQISVPLIRDGEAIGALSAARRDAIAFTDEQVALIKSFAAQAVIAIENARLLNELRESLQQQTATSDVLKVISRSTFDLPTVLHTLTESAARLCVADKGIILLADGDVYRLIANYGFSPEALRYGAEHPVQRDHGTLTGRVALEGKAIQIRDVLADPEYRATGYQQAFGYRTALAVPLLREEATIGVFFLSRDEVSPFNEKQIELVTTFADQAVIAIENARLLSELRQSLEQQTATSEVLQVISRSPSDLEPVFASMLDNAVRICDAKFGSIYRWTGGALHLVATRNAPAGYAEARRRLDTTPQQGDPMDRVLTTKSIVHIADFAAEPSYVAGHNPQVALPIEQGGVRTGLLVPMLLEDEPIGVFSLFRQEVRPFTDKEIGLVANFAAQAVIAIENARLLRELREKTDELAAQSQELAKLNQQLELRVTDQVDEIERMGRLRRFLPPQVADLIVASGSEKQLESHRREITALFCDLRGFTGFTESADAEDVMALLRDYHAAIGEIIIKYNGTLERYAGDGVMVVFNDPVPVENPALQAVLMALELRNAIGALTETWRRLGTRDWLRHRHCARFRYARHDRL